MLKAALVQIGQEQEFVMGEKLFAELEDVIARAGSSNFTGAVLRRWRATGLLRYYLGGRLQSRLDQELVEKEAPEVLPCQPYAIQPPLRFCLSR